MGVKDHDRRRGKCTAKNDENFSIESGDRSRCIRRETTNDCQIGKENARGEQPDHAANPG